MGVQAVQALKLPVLGGGCAEILSWCCSVVYASVVAARDEAATMMAAAFPARGERNCRLNLFDLSSFDCDRARVKTATSLSEEPSRDNWKEVERQEKEKNWCEEARGLLREIG